ncbi:MAG: DNA cytosine methyltransferase [Candidatus Nanoarchaeia archaeon]
MSYKVIELFAGAGGMALGFEKAGLYKEALVEIDKDCVNTLKHNRPNWNVIHENISKVDFKGMNADIVSGGFPCQPFSYAGKKLGFEDTRGTMFFEFARCVKEVQPKLVLAENVEGVLRHNNGNTLKTIVNVLEELGYKVKYKVINSVNHGVAQKRKRLIIVGTKDDYEFEFPQNKSHIVTLKKALENVPKSEGTRYSEKRKQVLELVPPGGCWIDLPIEIQKEFMGKSFYSGGGKRGMARRISWNEPCLTLTTSPSQKQTERCHPEETRPFTIREYARIQSFPDEWEFKGSVSSQYKQIGNAVAVEVGKILGEQIIICLNKETPSFVEDVKVKKDLTSYIQTN